MDYRPSVITMEELELAMGNAVASALDERGEQVVISSSFSIWNEPTTMGMYNA